MYVFTMLYKYIQTKQNKNPILYKQTYYNKVTVEPHYRRDGSH
jgi:hypothetical protein